MYSFFVGGGLWRKEFTDVEENHISEMATRGSKGAAARKAIAEKKKETVPTAADEQQLVVKKPRSRPRKVTSTKNKPELAVNLNELCDKLDDDYLEGILTSHSLTLCTDLFVCCRSRLPREEGQAHQESISDRCTNCRAALQFNYCVLAGSVDAAINAYNKDISLAALDNVVKCILEGAGRPLSWGIGLQLIEEVHKQMLQDDTDAEDIAIRAEKAAFDKILMVVNAASPAP